MLAHLLQGASAWLPSRCAICHAWPAQPLCTDCVTRFGQPLPRCTGCALPVPAGVARCGACLREPPPLDACVAALPYGWPWADCIARLKFRQDTGGAQALATLLRSTPWAEPALERADLVLPMPLSRERLAERGFNQALLLARALAPARTDATLLLRIRDTPPQRTLARAERLRAVRGAFAVEPLRAQALRGKRVVLVDDVMTSGASLHAAARTLRQAGAAHLTAMVVARTE